MKTHLRNVRDEAKSLRLSQIKAQKSAKALELMFAKETRAIAERIKVFLSSVVEDFKMKEAELRKVTDVETWENKIKGKSNSLRLHLCDLPT